MDKKLIKTPPSTPLGNGWLSQRIAICHNKTISFEERNTIYTNLVLLEEEYKHQQRNLKKAFQILSQEKRAKRVPKWLTRQDKKAISIFYANCPLGYHVDHIIPLQGKEISGLHVLSNLQYLPAEENLKKGSHYVI